MSTSLDEAVAAAFDQAEMRVVSAHKITDKMQGIQIGPAGNGRVWMRVMRHYFEFEKEQAEYLSKCLGMYAAWELLHD